MTIATTLKEKSVFNTLAHKLVTQAVDKQTEDGRREVTLRGNLIRAVLVAAAIGLVIVPLPAFSDHGCTPVNAAINTSFVGCPSQVCTSGTITGQGPLREGTTFFTLSGAAENPANPVGCVVGGFFCITDYQGFLTIDTRAGSLVLLSAGTVNFLSGQFSETEQVFFGTRAFSNVQGQPSISGTLTPDGSGFVGQLTGSLCHAQSH
jgi:hypothetical protein